MSDERKAIMGRNIEINLAKMGLNKSDLSKRLKIPMQTISNWCCGHTYPRIDKIELMANFFGINVTDLIDNPSSKENTLPTNAIKTLGTMKQIPLYSKIACGTPVYADSNVEEMMLCPSSIKADFAICCSGDSMIDYNINDGDIILIREQNYVENGEIAAVQIEDEATLKKVKYINGMNMQDGIILIPGNSCYDPIVCNDPYMNCRIVGKYVGLIRVV